MNRNNIVLATDSYKLNHWNQYPRGTEAVYSYFESREGATFPYTVFFGLQSILKDYLEGAVVTMQDVEEAQKLATYHFGDASLFNYRGWEYIVQEHGGRLPLRIKAVEEGSVIPTGNVLMSVENTDPRCFWLTNQMESLLTHVWYPSTVATLSRATKELIANFLDRTADSREGLDFMLHDFGYRGATTHEAAEIGGLGHLINFLGTDTLPAMLLGVEQYGADLASLAFSVPATEHSVMTAKGEDGEYEVVDQLLEEYPNGILSVVADSYNIYEFVQHVGTTWKDRILARDGGSWSGLTPLRWSTRVRATWLSGF
jgi:nicotinamide phosphoribosyltransferase